MIYVKRARRSGISAGIFSKKHNKHQTYKESTYYEKDIDFNIDDKDKKDYELKYYGKVMEEDTTPHDEVLDDVTEADKTPPVENYDENFDDDMKIIRKTGDENIEVVGRQNDITSSENDRLTAKKAHLGKNQHTEKRKKFAFIFTVSLVAIIFVSVLAFCISDLFGITSLFSDNSIRITEDYMKPVDDVTGKINVLVLGVDKEGLRTDTIILASFDTDNNTVNMLSIPRDTRMYIGSRYQKINSAHAISKSGKIKGPQGTIEAVTRLTGIPVNYYVEFSFDAFEETIDALGGIYFDVPQNMKYRDPEQDLYINLVKGYQFLDGDKAEQLVRFRQYPEGDIKRLRVQQNFIKSVAEQKLNAGIITKLPDLYKALSENIKTNFRLSDMTKYASTLLKLDVNNITMHELPGEYSGSEYITSYWLADMDKLAVLVSETFGYDASEITTGKPGSKSDDDILAKDKKITETSDKKTSSSEKTTSKTNNDDDDKSKKDSDTTKQPSKTDTTSTPTTSDKQETNDDKKEPSVSVPDAPEAPDTPDTSIQNSPVVEPEPEEEEPPKPAGRPVIPAN